MGRNVSPMGRSLNLSIRQELENLDKDADSRKSAMKALKSYVKELDTKAIPLFLAHVSETKETGFFSGEYTISLYEVLARVHGTNIVPQIDNIMATIIKTLKSSAGSFALHQACSKVVPSIARYGMDPTTPEDKKRQIIHSLCKPLLDCLLGSQESLSSGAALCLQALVDSDNWRFASDEMVNEVCVRVAGALEEKPTNSHTTLVMSLAKHNPLVFEAYARLLIQSGLRILSDGVAEKNSQKRLSAIQMLHFLIKCLDYRSICSELGVVIEEMEKCQSDDMLYVRGAALETLQTAKKIAAEKKSRLDKTPGSMMGSNFGPRRNVLMYGSRSPVSSSPESQTLGSFMEYDYMVESPFSTTNASRYSNYDRRSVNRKLWSNENGGVDVSLKDGLFAGPGTGNTTPNASPRHDRFIDNGGYQTDEFSGFLNKSPSNGIPRSTTSSPQRSRTHLNVDTIDIFTTPRKLIRSLQDPNAVNSDFSDKQARRFISPSRTSEWTPSATFEQNGHLGNSKVNGNLFNGDEHFECEYESVSSTEDIPTDADTNAEASCDATPECKTEGQRFVSGKTHKKTSFYCSWGLLVAFVVVLLFLSIMDIMKYNEETYYVVPT